MIFGQRTHILKTNASFSFHGARWRRARLTLDRVDFSLRPDCDPISGPSTGMELFMRSQVC
jgi:hypothetical protein